MKTAEEYAEGVECNAKEDCMTKDDWVTFIKQIQLDAWKQGARDAAQTLDHWHEGYTYYADRDVVGTDLEEIEGNIKADIYTLLRWKF